MTNKDKEKNENQEKVRELLNMRCSKSAQGVRKHVLLKKTIQK
jgi:hypothetical protein